MTQVKLNASLQSYNSFGIEAVAEEFVEVTSISELKEATDCNCRLQIMGGGTNLILLDNIPGRTVRVCIKEKSDSIELKKIIKNHHFYTQSKVAENILNSWEESIKQFKKILPREYARIINSQSKNVTSKKQIIDNEKVILNG